MRKKMISHGQRLNDYDSFVPVDVVVGEVETFQTTQDLVDGRMIRQRKVIKSHPKDKFSGFKVSDFSVASITSAGADSLLKSPSVLAGNTFRTLDNIPDPSLVDAAAAAASVPVSDSQPSNNSDYE